MVLDLTNLNKLQFEWRNRVANPNCRCIWMDKYEYAINSENCRVHDRNMNLYSFKKEKFMSYSEKLKAIVSVLRKRFNNLSAEELIDLATQILEVLEEK